MNDTTPTIVELIGIYDADGTILGELRYVIGRQFKGTHCSLCDITHGTLRERADWRTARDELEVTFTALHRNESTPEMRQAAERLPAVLATLDDGTVRCIVTADQLASLGPDPQGLVAAIRRNADQAGLAWPDAPD